MNPRLNRLQYLAEVANRQTMRDHPMAAYLAGVAPQYLGDPSRTPASESGMTPTQVGSRSMRDPEAYARWKELWRARHGEGVNQNRLGPLEHGAFAESLAREHPVLGPLGMLAAIPAYNAAKAVGIAQGWFEPSVDAMAEAYRGVGRGVARNLGFD